MTIHKEKEDGLLYCGKPSFGKDYGDNPDCQMCLKSMARKPREIKGKSRQTGRGYRRKV